MKFKKAPLILSLSLVLPLFPLNNAEAAENCQIDPDNMQQVNQLLTEKAKEYHIPPEVVKAIALQESGWKQDLISSDPGGTKGYGIMQVTDDIDDKDQLLNNICYNVDRGLQKLNEKWNWTLSTKDRIIPMINQGDRNIIENWYFPILAYNGLVSSNSPLYHDTGARNRDAYQEEVFNKINRFSFVNDASIALKELPFETSYFKYNTDPDSDDAKLNITVDQIKDDRQLTSSTLNFKTDDITIATSEVKFYSDYGVTEIAKLPKGTLLQVTEENQYVRHTKASPFDQYRQWVLYRVEVLNGSLKGKRGYTASAYLQPVTSRISGDSRYTTAAGISNVGWYEGAETVIIASGNNYPDALSGTTLASHYDAPILLLDSSKQEKIDSSIAVIKEEVERLGAENAIILGGKASIPQSAEDKLKSFINIQDRISGDDRYETAYAIANHILSKQDSNTMILATGESFPDALAIAPYAAQNGIPILLSDKNGKKLDQKMANLLNSKSNVIVVGGENAISSTVTGRINDDRRISGENRYETAEKIIGELNIGNHHGYVATGENYADALTGAVLAAKFHDPIILTKPSTVPPVISELVQSRFTQLTLLGGKSAITDQTTQSLAEKAKNAW
ncbi:cell wall-binding repeat-containing protein [Bacillus salacetis]|uniref:cell wall-binding repeat-containing protein n=1 Tax=Bacillus salacetis TaxID=2315464 RepID=UPI003BA2675A